MKQRRGSWRRLVALYSSKKKRDRGEGEKKSTTWKRIKTIKSERDE